MPKEIRVPFSKLKDPQTITSEMEAHFTEMGLDMHRHEVESLEDDHKRGERVLRVKNTKYFPR